MVRKTKQVDLRPEAVHKNWSNIDDLAVAHEANLAHDANNIDHGFDTTRPALIPADPNHDIFPPIPELDHPIEERKYIAQIQEKLSLAQAFVREENVLSLDPTRPPHKDVVAVELAKGPIMFTFRTQEVIRDLVNLRAKIYKLAEDQAKNQQELQDLMADFLWAWKDLRGVLEFVVPGPTEGERTRRAEVIMANILGENIVGEEGEEGEDSKADTKAEVGVDEDGKTAEESKAIVE